MIVDIEFDKAASVRSAIAVEFTANSVRVMQLYRKNSKSNIFSVRSYGEAKLNAGDISDGIIQNPTVVGMKLNEAIQASNPRRPDTQYCICLIPQHRTFLTVLDLPAVEKEELREILERRVAEIIPMQESEVYWDWHRIQTTDSKTKVQLAAVPKAMIDSYMQTLEGAKLIPLLFEPSATAASRVAFPSDSSQLQNLSPEPVILLELKAEYGVISLQQQGGIVFSTDISLKSDSMAEKVIVLEQKISEIAEYSQTHLKVKPQKSEITTLVFGMKQQIDTLLPLLQERSSSPIQIINPKTESPEVSQFLQQHSDLSFFPLLGAATRGVQDYGEESTLNLIPQKAKEAFRKKELYNVLRDYLMFVAINTVFLVFMLLIVAFQVRSRVDDLQSKYESILAISNSPIVNEIEDSVDLLNARTTELNSLITSLYDWTLLTDMLNTATPPGVVVSSLVANPNAEQDGALRTSWTLTIAGQAGDRETVLRYVNNLRNAGLLEEVKLPLESLQDSNNTNFVIEAVLPFKGLLPISSTTPTP